MANRGLTVDFNANVVRFTNAVDRATNDLAKFQTNADRISKNVDRSFARMGSNLRMVFGGVVTAATVQQLGQMADSFTNMQSRLRLATRDADEFAQANENIKRIAESSKAPLESTAVLYTRIAQSLLDVGGTQQQIANTTQALAVGLRVSGASAEESASAMLQFSQAIASGVLRGEEFNAVNEAAPRVMKALADSIGVPVGKLREMAQEGRLTRDILVEGLGSQLPKLISEAETLPDTIGTAFQAAKNELFLAVGAMDKFTGASSKAAGAVNSITQAANRLRASLEGGGSLFGWIISRPEEEANAAASVASLEQKVARMKKMRDELSAPTAANWINDFIFGDVRDLNAQIATIESKIKHLNSLAKQAAKIDKAEPQADPEAGIKALLAKADAEAKAKKAQEEAKKAAEAAQKAAQQLANQQKTFIDGLKKEADTLGMTSVQMKVYEASLLKINGARLDGVRANAERIEAFEQEQEVLEAMRNSYANAADAYNKFIQATQADVKSATEKVDRLKLEISLMKETEAARNKALAQYDLEVKYEERLKELRGQSLGEGVFNIQKEALERAKAHEAEVVRMQELVDTQKKAAAETQKVWDNFGWNFQRNVGDQLYDTLNGNFDDIGQRWKSMLLRMLSDALAADLSNAIFGKQGFTGLLSMLGSVMGSFAGIAGGAGGGGAIKVTGGGLTGFAAKGAWFDGSVAAFANGGIVNSPTLFKFASGGSFKTGLMGEAGPEAIMPLKRDSQGRLGVSGGGGGLTINDNRVFQIDSRSDRASLLQDMQKISRQSNAELVEKLGRQRML